MTERVRFNVCVFTILYCIFTRDASKIDPQEGLSRTRGGNVSSRLREVNFLFFSLFFSEKKRKKEKRINLEWARRGAASHGSAGKRRGRRVGDVER